MDDINKNAISGKAETDNGIGKGQSVGGKTQDRDIVAEAQDAANLKR